MHGLVPSVALAQSPLTLASYHRYPTFRPSVYSPVCAPLTTSPGNCFVEALSRKPFPTNGYVKGDLPDGLTLPNSTSATMLPSSCPGNHASRMAGPDVPTSAGSIATPALSLSTKEVFLPISGPASMRALIIATVLLFFAGLVPPTVAMTLERSAYQSRSS